MSIKKRAPAYSLKGVGFSYGKNRVLDDITAEIKEGDYLGIVGPNGGGKTTLLKILLGVLEPTEGTVKLFGESLRKSGMRKRIGYVPQRANAVGEIFPATVEEIVASGRTPLSGIFSAPTKEDRRAIEEAMEVAGVLNLRKRRIGTLSGGERQRTLIARALASGPKVLILDEPTSAVDVQSQEVFYEFLRELRTKLKLTIILVSHDLDIVSHEVDEILCLNKRLVCYGPVEEVMESTHLIHGHH